MMFAWTNSYNKQVKFKCVVGAYIDKIGSVMTCGDIGTWTRKHTGTADTETQETIDSHIQNAYMYYNQLVSDKTQMEQISMNKRKQAQMLGILFGEYQILTTEQASIVRDQMKKPIHVLSSTDTLWAFYNYVTLALQTSHPRTWMEDQRILHHFISEVNKFAPVSQPVPIVSEPVQDLSEPVDLLYAVPGQTNILDQIAEIEAQEIVNDEIVTYTDPVGNTFEAPVVTESFMDQLEEAMVEKQEEENEFIETQLYDTEDDGDFTLDFSSDDTEEDQEFNGDFF
jgi:hypothetical protein